MAERASVPTREVAADKTAAADSHRAESRVLEPPVAQAIGGDLSSIAPHVAMRLGSPDDPAERDADRVAGHVLGGRMASSGSASRYGAEKPLDGALQDRLRARCGGGTALEPSVRARVDPFLDRPLGSVRIHTDSTADDLAQKLGARAFTLDRNVFFARNSYRPERLDGLRLISHELAHTVQAQGSNSPVRMQSQPSPKPAPPKVANLAAVVFYRDLDVITLRLDDGKLITDVQVVYNGKPRPGTYKATWNGKTFELPRIAAATPNLDGYAFLWSTTEPFNLKGVLSYAVTVVPGTGTKGATGGTGGEVPTPARKPKPAEGEGEAAATKPGKEGGGGGQEQNVGATGKKPAPEPAGKAPPTSPPGETLSDREYVERLRALPPEIKEIMGGEPSFDPGEYEALLAIAEKLKRFTPAELELYRQLATKMALDLAALEQSIDLFFELKDDIKRQIDAQAAQQQKELTLEQRLDQTWKGFDESKFASLSADQKERMARDLADKQTRVQLEHMVTHPGETALGMVEGVVRPDKVADAIVEDVKEAFDGSRNGFARAAGAVGAAGKFSGWLAGIAGVLFIAMLFVPGANLVELAMIGLVAGTTAAIASAAEAELRIQSAKRETDPARYKSDVGKSAAAQANVIVQAIGVALHLSAKLIAKIPLGARYQNVGTALKTARSSLIRVTGAGAAFESVRAALIQRLRGARSGLKEALAVEVKPVAATAASIKAMSGKTMLERIVAGDAALSEATGITPDAARMALDTAKSTGSTALPDQVRQRVLTALEEGPKQAERRVTQFTDSVDKAVAEAQKAKTPAELDKAIDVAEGRTSPVAVAAQERAAQQQYAAARLKEELAPKKAPPSQPTQPSPSEPAKPTPSAKPQKPDVTAEPAKPAKSAPPKAGEPEPKPVEPAKPATPPKPAESKPASRDWDLAVEEKLLKQAEKVEAAKPAKKPSAPAPDPQATAAAAAAKQRLAVAEQDLSQLTAQRQAVRGRARTLEQTVARERQAMRAFADEELKLKNPAAKAAARQNARDAKARMEAAAREKGVLDAEGDALGPDIADKQQSVRIARLAADPKHRAALPCFAADTPVWTRNGMKRIDQLHVDDEVLSFDFAEGNVVRRRVREVFRNRTLHFYDLRVGGETIRATGRHRFWIAAKRRWVEARELECGMTLRAPDGAELAIDAVELVDVAEQDSWNLRIETTPHFFVGPGALVHNNGGFSVGLGGRITVYRAVSKNPKFKGKIYIGQTVDLNIRHLAHRRYALTKLANRAALTPAEIEFFEFMSDIEPLEPLVSDLKKDHADFVEQRNIDLETEAHGKSNVMNRRAQIRSESHMKAVTERIANDPAVQKAGLCPR